MRSRSWLLAAAVAIAVQTSPMLETVSAQSSPGIVLISEFRFKGPATAAAGVNDEFIELYNPGPAEVSLAGWTLRVSNASGGTAERAKFPAAAIAAGCRFLIVNNNTNGGFSGGVAPDLTYVDGFPDIGGGAAILDAAGVIVDQVGFATAGYGEGPRLLPLTSVLSSYERKPGGALGNGQDTHNNADDFRIISPATPQNSDQANCVTEKVLLTHEVQGSGPVSEMAGSEVTVRGVVTARANGGFFLQTADSDSDDDNPQTSEGLFVAHVSAAAQVGRVLHVRGTVAEFDPADPTRGPVTHLRRVTNVTEVADSLVPAPYELTAAELNPNGSLDQLERFEGMRVAALLRSVSGTNLDGSFYAVLDHPAVPDDGMRPFREPGIEVGSPALGCASEPPCAFESFDGNPERLRVDSDGIENVAAVHLSAGAVMNLSADGAMTGVIGPLDFAVGAYTLLPESLLQPSGGTMMMAAPAAGPGRFSIASLNLGDAGAFAEDTRLAKAASMVQTMLNEPDIVAVQGDENAAVLGELAKRLAAYEAHLDSFLVKSSRVTVVSVEPIYQAPVDGSAPLFDRSPVMLHAVVNGGALVLPQQITVLNNQLRSLAEAGRADATGQQVRAQRHAQAEWLANFVQNRQLNDPNEAIVLLGNFNAHAFNDGYVDTMGTVLGSPAPADQVVLASPDLVSPDLIYLSGGYSSVANGNAQSLDHMLATANLGPRLTGFSHARVNADFPEALRALPDNPGRLSDRDPPVAYFSFPPDVDPPVFGLAPDQLAEATGPDGAAVNFPVPTATDNLDAVVAVTCTPASGSVFALGDSGVLCAAQDVAGNRAQVSFAVTVQDTTAPVLTMPTDINEEASSPDGRVITFAASAIDAVSGSVGVSCVPASGSTFPIGTTAVECTALDGAGNLGSANFSVTVTRPIPGRLHGGGTVYVDSKRMAFTFDVGESANFVERGWLSVLAMEGAGRPRPFTGQVHEVSFSDAADYAAGSSAPSGVDTVTFSGFGSWNGLPGYRFLVTASDRGEPGVDVDTFSLVVTSPAGIVVESISGALRGGNIQSLRH